MKILYWIWGCALLRVFETSPSFWMTKWAMFPKAQGVCSSTYRCWMVDWETVAYVKVSLRHSKSYAGCIRQGIVAREATRWRKYKQKSRLNVEPAIRWWRRSGSYHDFCPIVWACCPSKADAEFEETPMIDMKKNKLNVPFVYQLFPEKKRTAGHFQSRGIQEQVHKARRLRQRGPWLQFTPARWNDDSVTKVWRTLTNLGSLGPQSGEIMKRLFSEHLAEATEIYMLHRVAGVLEEPFKSFVRGKLRRVLDVRGLARPCKPRPLTTPFLAHDGYKHAVKGMIKELLTECKAGAIPLHLPCAAVVEARWLTVRDVLFNQKSS